MIASFTVFYMDDKELMLLHWKEFTPAILSLAVLWLHLYLEMHCFINHQGACIAAYVILLILKFLIGPLKAQLHAKW